MIMRGLKEALAIAKREAEPYCWHVPPARRRGSGKAPAVSTRTAMERAPAAKRLVAEAALRMGSPSKRVIA
jgi:hypothetical protein